MLLEGTLITRRQSLLLSMATLAGPILSSPARAVGSITVAHGFAAGSVTAGIAAYVTGMLRSGGLSTAEAEAFPGEHGFNGYLYLQSRAADGEVVLVADTLTLALNAVDRGIADEVRALVPLVKMTLGFSTALIASPASGIRDWAGFAEAAKTRPLRVATSGRLSAYGPAIAWASRLTAPFEEVHLIGNKHLLDAVASNAVDAAVVTTASIPPVLAEHADAVVTICSFGAKRSPLFPALPTFAELSGNDKLDYTFAFSTFAKAGTPASVLAPIIKALSQPVDPTLAEQLGPMARGMLATEDAAAVTETLERDIRVAKSALG
jgi:tripartite-type tricarboxylate transporter receptor subunit TctC